MQKININQKVMESNEILASRNRKLFQKSKIMVLNILGSPGAGKTSFLEASLITLCRNYQIGVIEGDLATTRDADRINDLGIPVEQINTQGGCHLDAAMIAQVLPQFDLASLDLLIVENVGNLVCPATFDLGEDFKIIVLSVAEGGDKPVKYPRTFMEAKVVIINKIDLLPFTDVDLTALRNDLLRINPQLKIFEVSCRERKGLEAWHHWLKTELKGKREHAGISSSG